MLYFSAIVLSCFLSFVLITKKNKSKADYFLAIWLGIIGFHLFTFYLFAEGYYVSYPGLTAMSFSLPLAHGPFLYLYVRRQTTGSEFDKKELLHFTPILLSYLLFAEFYFMPGEQQVEVFLNKGSGFKMRSIVNMIAVHVSGIIYVTLSLMRLFKYRRNVVHQFSNTEKINFNWLFYLIAWIGVIWIFVLFKAGDQLVFGSAAVFVIWLGYFGIMQVQVFTQRSHQLSSHSSAITELAEADLGSPAEVIAQSRSVAPAESSESGKYQKSSLSEEMADVIHQRLKKLMDEQEPYKNPDLELNELAQQLNVHPNHLSQVINSKEKKTFYDLVNEKRVEEFIRLSALPANRQFTLLALAFDCGFNSKASFNRNFKKYTGQSPSDFLKQLSSQK